MRPAQPFRSSAAAGPAWLTVSLCVFGALMLSAATRSVSQSRQPLVGTAESTAAAYARITHLAAVLNAATNAETCAYGYVITGDAGFLVPYEQALAAQDENMTELETLYAGDLERAPLLSDVRDALTAQRAHMSRAVAFRQALSAEHAAQLLEGFRVRELTDSVRVAIRVMVTDEHSALARQRAQVASATSAETRGYVLGGLGVALLVIASAVFVRGRRRRSAALSVQTPQPLSQYVDSASLLSDFNRRDENERA